MSLLKTSKVFKVIYVYAISQHAIKFHVCRTGNKSRFYCFFIRYNRELSVWVTMLTQILDYVCQIKKMPSHNMVFATENRLREEFYYVTQWLSVRGLYFRLIDTAQSALLSRSVCYNLISPVTPPLFLNCIW